MVPYDIIFFSGLLFCYIVSVSFCLRRDYMLVILIHYSGTRLFYFSRRCVLNLLRAIVGIIA